MRKPTKKSIKKKLLAAWSLAVKERDGFKCVVCGATEHLNSHHIYNKTKYPEYSLNLDNGITLCPTHHVFGKEAAETNAFFITYWLWRHRFEQFVWAVEIIASCINTVEDKPNG